MNTLKQALASVFNIRSGEGRITALLLLHSFCTGAATVSFSTAASALFLAAFDVGVLPYVYIGSAGMAVLIGLLYTRLQSRLPFPTLLVATLSFLLITVTFFRLSLWASESKWIVFSLLFWLRIVLVLSNLEFWGLTARLFNVRQGKRLFGLIGAGEVSANILGGFATPAFVMMFGTPNLLLLSIGGLVLSLGLLLIIIGMFREQLSATPTAQEPAQKPVTSRLWASLKHPYAGLIILSNALMVIIYSFVDYTFYDFTKMQYQDEMHLAMFIGPFFAVVQIINILTRTFVASRLFNRLGLQFGLLLHPLLLVGLSILIAATYGVMGMVGVLFWLVVMMKLCDEVMWSSIYDSSLLILYQPLPVDQRRTTQAAVQSIFGPIAIVVSGSTLLLLGTREAFTSVHLTYIMPLLLAAALVVVRLVHRQYPKALTQALAKRTLEDVNLSLQDCDCLAVVHEKLHSPHTGEILYALDLLEQSEHDSLLPSLIDLLEHPDATIRRDVLQRLERARASEAFPAVAQRLAVEEIPGVQAAAVRAMCALGDNGWTDAVAPYLEDPQPELRAAAMVGLLRYGGIEGVLVAGERLMHAVRSPEPAQRVFAARGLGEVGLQPFYQPLIPLLNDAEPVVHRAALEAASHIRHPKLWPLVLPHLSEPGSKPEIKNAAASTLAAGGEAALPVLASAMARNGRDRQTQVRLARICGRIRGEGAIAILRNYIGVPDPAIRLSVITSLSACDYHARPDDLVTLRQQIEREGEEAAWNLAALCDIGERDEVGLLRDALLYNLHQLNRCLFLLLSFMVDGPAMRQAWETFSHPSAEKRAYALEVVDVLVPQEQKAILLPLIEDLSAAERLQRLQDRFPQRRLTCEQRLQDIVSHTEDSIPPWTQACALHSLAQLSTPDGLETIAATLSTPEPIVRETAMRTLMTLAPATYHRSVEALRPDASLYVQGEEQTMSLSTIEKVIILKTVPIFAETPDEVLAEVATILDEVEFGAGDIIFEKGDVGSCLYVIVDGEVRVHEGERTLTQLGERAIFGELAVLDPEPRSASVTATEPTRLFRLDQESFYDLMADRIEVARGIIRALCRDLRSRTTTPS